MANISRFKREARSGGYRKGSLIRGDDPIADILNVLRVELQNTEESLGLN